MPCHALAWQDMPSQGMARHSQASGFGMACREAEADADASEAILVLPGYPLKKGISGTPPKGNRFL